MRRASVFHACCKWISAPSRHGVAVRASPHVEQEAPSSLITVDRKALSNAFPLYRASARWLTSRPSDESASSSWDVGHPPVHEHQKERGQTKSANEQSETPTPSLARETNTREMFHAKARETEGSASSTWDVGHPPVHEHQKERGQTKAANRQSETPTPSLARETNIREMFHAQARETEERLSQEGKLEGSSTAAKPKVASSMIEEAEGTSVWALGMKVTLKCPGDRTNGSYSLMEYELAPGDGCQTHTHSQEDETWYLLDGELEWTLRDSAFQAKKGCYIHLPSGIPHSFHNKSGKPARMLVSCLPAGLEKYFLEIGVPVDPNPDSKRPAISEEDARAATKAGKKWGVTFAS